MEQAKTTEQGSCVSCGTEAADESGYCRWEDCEAVRDARQIRVRPFQLLQWKHAIRLEAKGIKVARRSVRTHAAKHFGLKPRTPHAEVLQHIQAALDACESAGVGAMDSADISIS